MADTYFAKLSQAEDLPPAFDGIASSLDDFFANLALYGVDITFGDPDYPPNPDPDPGPPPIPDDGELDFSDTYEPPPTVPSEDPTGEAPGPEVHTKRLVTMQLEALSDVEIGLPSIDDIKFVLNPAPFEVKLSLEPGGFLIEATVGLAVRFDAKLLVPMVDTGGGNFEVDPTAKSVDILVAAAIVKVTEDGVALSFPTGLVLARPAMIGETGVIVESANLSFNFDGTGGRPDGAHADWRGVLFNDASVRIPSVFSGAIVATKLGFGSGGVSGTIAKTIPVSTTDTVLGMQGGVTQVAISLRENILTGCAISARVLMPFFDENNPLDVLIALSTDGTVTATLVGSLATVKRDNVVEFTVKSVTFGVEKGTAVVAMSGLLHPLAGGLEWPSFEIEDLRIDAHGNVTFAGGWIDLDKQLCLNLYGFQLEITRIGMGKNDAGENWLGFNGSLKLLEGVPAGASVEGLRILWGGSAGIHVTLEGVGVELEVPGVVKIAGKVSLTGEEFKGAVRVELESVSVQLEGQFVAGTAEDPITHAKFKTYAVYLQMQLPTGIPLGTTGLALYGFAGLYAHNREPGKLETEGWYLGPNLEDGWYTRSPKGITQVGEKWRGAKGHTGFGAGVILGTYADNGYLFNGRLLLVLVFPGPVILIEGMANLLKKRSALGAGEPNFHALVVIDPGKSITAGLDAQYKFGSSGELLAIRGSAQAYFDFDKPNDWYINIGVDKPPENRIRARAFNLFDLNAYFMLSATRLQIGGGWSYRKRWGFKHLYVGLGASMDTAAYVSWHPAHFTGSIAVAGTAELHAFCISANAWIGAKIVGDVFDPFGLSGEFSVGLNLPWPLPDVSATVHMDWTEESTAWPALPVPVREGSVEHLKSRNTWPLARGQSLFGDPQEVGELEFERPGNNPPSVPDLLSPPFSAGGPIPTIPADSKVALTFTRPVDDPNGIALQSAKVDPEYIGDPDVKRAAYTVGYSLSALELQKWAPGAESSDGSATWTTIAKGGTSAGAGTQLSVAFQPGHEDRDAGHSEQLKMLVNAVTPFDYAAERSQSWQEWFTAANPDFPCPLAIPELSARFTDPVGTECPSKHVHFTSPEFDVSWVYGGTIRDNDIVIPTVLGPIERGMMIAPASNPMPQDTEDLLITVNPPDGHDEVLIRVGSPTPVFGAYPTFSATGLREGENNAPNPLALDAGVTLRMLDGRSPNAPQSSENRIGVLSNGYAVLKVGARLEISTVLQPMYIELDVEIETTGASGYEAFGIAVDGSEGPHTKLIVGHNTLRFRGSNSVALSLVVLRRTTVFGLVPKARLHRVSWRPPLRARAYDGSGSTMDFYEPLDGLFQIYAEGLSKIEILGRPGEGMTLLEMALPADNLDLVRHALSSVSRLTKEDPLFEPENDYRLVVTTLRSAKGALGTPAPLTSSNSFVHHAYFHVSGPPGIGAPDQPPEQPDESKTGATGLSDLRLYVEQTLPHTIPEQGGKLLLPRAFYRGYDVAVKFNEAYVELMYHLARRTLTTRLFDVHDASVLTKGGRVSIPVPSWERSRQQSLKESVALWTGMVNDSLCRPDDVPPFDTQTVVRVQTLSAPGDELVLDPETLYQARLVPSLLHETFVETLPGLIADNSGHRLERWSVEADASSAPRWEVDSRTISLGSGDTAVVFFVKETTGQPSSLLYAGPLGARESQDAPSHWSDLRASASLRWSGGIVGVEVRRTSGIDMLRFTLDRGTGARRLAAVVSGTETALASDTTTFPEPSTDVLITVECLADRVQIYQDGAPTPIFDVTGAPQISGTLALWADGATDASFTEIRVDDLRQSPSSAFKFDFVTSKYTNFHHHLHSYSSLLFDGATGSPLTAGDLTANAGPSVPVPSSGDGLGTVSDDERRAFEALEAKALGTAALRPAERIEISRVSAVGEPIALLVRSPEPLLWERISLNVSGSADSTPLPTPGNIILSDVTFGAAPADESVTVLVRNKRDLAGQRLDWRPLPTATEPDPAWTPYATLGATDLELEDGFQVKLLAVYPGHAPPREPGTVQVFAAADEPSEAVRFSAPGVELRLLAADGATVLHQRRFLTPDAFAALPMRALRKLDGTAMLLFPDPPAPVTGVAALRLHWQFRRVLGDEDLRYRQSGSEMPESAVLDVVLPSAV